MTNDDNHKDEQSPEDEDLKEESSEESLSEASDADDDEQVDASEDDSEEEETSEEDASDDEEDASDDDDEDEASDDDDEEDASDDDDEEEASDNDDEVEASDDDDEDEASDDDDEDEASDDDDEEDASDDDDKEEEDIDESSDTKIVAAGDDGDSVVPPAAADDSDPQGMKGIAAFFDVPDNLMIAASHTRESEYEDFDAFSPFPIHGMDDAMGLGRSWIPWVTFGAGAAGFLTANALQFGTMTFDWPMIIGGKPYAPWPAFVPIMFELTVLLAGCTTALVMLIAAGCFKKPFIIDPEITKDRFALWISADDENFDADEVREFMESLDPVEVRTITRGV